MTVVRFAIRLPSDFVYQVDGSSSQEAKDIYNMQRDMFFDIMRKALKFCSVDWHKEYAIIYTSASIEEIRKFLEVVECKIVPVKIVPEKSEWIRKLVGKFRYDMEICPHV